MKTHNILSLTTLIAALIFSVSSVQAQTANITPENIAAEESTPSTETLRTIPVDFQSYFRQTDNGKVEFHLRKDSSQTMFLHIRDKEGQILHSRKFGQKVGKYQKAFRLDRFPNGEYEFELEREGKVISSTTVSTAVN